MGLEEAMRLITLITGASLNAGLLFVSLSGGHRPLLIDEIAIVLVVVSSIAIYRWSPRLIKQVLLIFYLSWLAVATTLGVSSTLSIGLLQTSLRSFVSVSIVFVLLGAGLAMCAAAGYLAIVEMRRQANRERNEFASQKSPMLKECAGTL
ncbi:hypothetical protein [Pseudomonas fluorescens]|uniref:hypothetical protein n=1 Tax=Pseudomonas fluorescens TaxID=294 RepID=UPI00130E2389|nr:hypothetical protein [Pseudomonas fluorescens]